MFSDSGFSDFSRSLLCLSDFSRFVDRLSERSKAGEVSAFSPDFVEPLVRDLERLSDLGDALSFLWSFFALA